MIGLPPSDVGGVQVTVALPFPGVATTFVGVPGVVRGVMALDGVEGGPLPAAFVATTVNV